MQTTAEHFRHLLIPVDRGERVAKHSLLAETWPFMHCQRLVLHNATRKTVYFSDKVSQRDVPMLRAQDHTRCIGNQQHGKRSVARIF